MSLWRVILGDIGQDMDLSAAEKEIESLKDLSQAKSHVDRKQDAAVAHLYRRVFELEQVLSALMKRLVEKNVLTTADLADFARFMAEAERKAAAAGPKFESVEERAPEVHTDMGKQ